MTHVSIRNLTKTYPGAARPALDRLCLEVEDGELAALLGPSGCGKTTVLKLLAGLAEATAGEISFDGSRVDRERPEHRNAAMVFQAPMLFPFMSVADNIGFGLRMRKVPKAEISGSVGEMLALVQLDGLGNRRPSQLSGGQQQRVALARALILRPRVLLLDEPLSNLDAHLRLEMRELIRTVQSQMRITTIFVTHDLEEAVALAGRIALILEGNLRQHDKAEAFYTRPADEAVARFFGAQNFVPGTSDGAVFQSALGPLLLPGGVRAGPGKLTFRPESIRLGDAGANTLVARLVEKTYLGTHSRLRFMVSDVAIAAVVSPDAAEALATGTLVPITLPRKALWVL